jgi:hypothetical protein
MHAHEHQETYKSVCSIVIRKKKPSLKRNLNETFGFPVKKLLLPSSQWKKKKTEQVKNWQFF